MPTVIREITRVDAYVWVLCSGHGRLIGFLGLLTLTGPKRGKKPQSMGCCCRHTGKSLLD